MLVMPVMNVELVVHADQVAAQCLADELLLDVHGTADNLVNHILVKALLPSGGI